MRASSTTPVLVVMCLLIAGACDATTDRSPASTQPAHAIEPNAVIDRVIDGDTVDVEIRGDTERVRLTGIDTPEIAHPAIGDRPATEGECFGAQAAAYTSSLVPPGTAVRLERDVVARDDYGRLLAYLYRASDGVFVNYEIVRHGFARPLTIAPNDAFSEFLVEATRQAEAAEAGLWSACRDR